MRPAGRDCDFKEHRGKETYVVNWDVPGSSNSLHKCPSFWHCPEASFIFFPNQRSLRAALTPILRFLIHLPLWLCLLWSLHSPQQKIPRSLHLSEVWVTAGWEWHQLFGYMPSMCTSESLKKLTSWVTVAQPPAFSSSCSSVSSSSVPSSSSDSILSSISLSAFSSFVCRLQWQSQTMNSCHHDVCDPNNEQLSSWCVRSNAWKHNSHHESNSGGETCLDDIRAALAHDWLGGF